ncbi:CFEM domain-containing protein [Aspergillus lucknowensis]|uniref:CFEM domain-containing protein n=1 Tax=Aspergillus lucknowensis TaxID=176173 RepID=A0ABR4LS41_9EURO
MDGLPSCPLLCLVQAIPSSSCSLLDIDCICHDGPLFARVQDCGMQNCTMKDNLKSMRLLYETCDYPVTVANDVFPAVIVAGVTLSSIAVTLRIAGRLIGSRLGLDDAVIMLSLAAAVAIAVIGLIEASLGLGKDVWFLSFDKITQILHAYFIAEALYITSIALSKMSMLLLFLRLFPDENFRRATYLVLAFTTCWGLTVLFANVFACQPLSYYWNMWDGEHEGKCISQASLLWAHAVINILLDVVIIGLPTHTLLKLNLSWRRKLAICSMFAVGIVVTIVSILRFVSSLHFDITDNPTKKFVPVGAWSLVEVYLSIICACMPGIRAFFNYTWSRYYTKNSIYSSSPSASNGNSNGHSNGEVIPSPREVTSGTFHSANREQGEFIRLQEISSSKA